MDGGKGGNAFGWSRMAKAGNQLMGRGCGSTPLPLWTRYDREERYRDEWETRSVRRFQRNRSCGPSVVRCPSSFSKKARLPKHWETRFLGQPVLVFPCVTLCVGQRVDAR
jgi:hypothetical protein